MKERNHFTDAHFQCQISMNSKNHGTPCKHINKTILAKEKKSKNKQIKCKKIKAKKAANKGSSFYNIKAQSE